MLLNHIQRMAHYNRWANLRLFDACARLPLAEYEKDRAAFFGSIHGTLNHVIVGDRLWMGRFERSLVNYRLDDRPFADLPSLRDARHKEDERIIAYTLSLDAADLAGDLHYVSVALPGEISVPLDAAILHMFNHQTHHRGQVHSMLSQIGEDPPPLDLIYFLLEEKG